MSMSDSLVQLANSTLDAVAGALSAACGDELKTGPVAAVEEGVNPLAAVPFPAVVATVSYDDGAAGGNVFAIGVTGARKLAAAMMGRDPQAAADAAAELDELELSAVSEAMNQMMTAAAAATSGVLGERIEIAAPTTAIFGDPDEALDACEPTPHKVSVALNVFGETCRLVQLVPNAFIVRMTRALTDLAAEYGPAGEVTGSADEAAVASSLRAVDVRFSAELGRTSMRLADVVGLPAGTVVELDCEVDAPIELYVNGTRFATGRLLVAEQSEWAVRIDQIVAVPGRPEGN
jgi:flagellar motor switch protein FliN/FliY